MSQRVAIIGGGPAGYEAALVAADLGADVTLICDEGLGGNSVLWDCVPSKSVIVAAEAMGWVHAAHEMGIHLGETDVPDRMLVDWPEVTGRALALGAEQSADIEAKVADCAIRRIHGRGAISGYHEVTATSPDGQIETFEADFVLVATGSAPRVLPFFKPDGKRVLVGKDVFGLEEVPERLLVVGSGATGAEFAHAFASFGSDVVVVSSREHILPTTDPDAAEVIERVFERRGMEIVRNARAISCASDHNGVRVGLEGREELTGSHALFCVGQVPVTGGIGLDLPGVEVGDRGEIPVDGVSRTTCRWLYAAGDVTGGIMLASTAAMQGRIAMYHALGRGVTPIRTESIAATIFTDPEMATVGLMPEDAEAHGIPITTKKLDFATNPRAKMIGATDGFAKIHAMTGSGIVVGGVVVGRRASDLIHPISVAVHNRLSVTQLAQTITVYPSMSGSIAEVARQLAVSE